jgi:SAM-dependent methyltransferase
MMEPYALALEQWNSEQGCLDLMDHWERSEHKHQAERLIGQMVSSLPHHATVVDLGCGPGRLVGALPEFTSYRGYDISATLLQAARGRYAADTRCMFLERNAFSGAPYRKPADVLLCIDLSRHYPDPMAFLLGVIERWPARAYLVNVLHGPKAVELINGTCMATADADRGLSELGRVRRAEELPIPDSTMSVRYVIVEAR